MESGHVYALQFSDGTVKVGRTEEAQDRLRAHEQTAKGFGLSVTGKWLSPEHAGWVENEGALKRLAGELGGTCRGSEWFAGVDFGELTARASGLKFPEPVKADEATWPGSGAGPMVAEGKRHRTPGWLQQAVTRYAETSIPRDGIPVEQAVAELRKLAMSDRQLMRNLADDYVRSRLSSALSGARYRALKARDKPKPRLPARKRPREEKAA